MQEDRRDQLVIRRPLRAEYCAATMVLTPPLTNRAFVMEIIRSRCTAGLLGFAQLIYGSIAGLPWLR